MPPKYYTDINGVRKRFKNRIITVLLALFLGFLGAHKFYLGRLKMGIVYLLFSWTGVPLVIGIIEAIMYMIMTNKEFNAKYNS